MSSRGFASSSSTATRGGRGQPASRGRGGRMSVFLALAERLDDDEANNNQNNASSEYTAGGNAAASDDNAIVLEAGHYDGRHVFASSGRGAGRSKEFYLSSSGRIPLSSSAAAVAAAVASTTISSAAASRQQQQQTAAADKKNGVLDTLGIAGSVGANLMMGEVDVAAYRSATDARMLAAEQRRLDRSNRCRDEVLMMFSSSSANKNAGATTSTAVERRRDREDDAGPKRPFNNAAAAAAAQQQQNQTRNMKKKSLLEEVLED